MIINMAIIKSKAHHNYNKNLLPVRRTFYDYTFKKFGQPYKTHAKTFLVLQRAHAGLKGSFSR